MATNNADFKVKKGLIVTEDIELGHATDTTIARASAGQITVEGTAVVLAGGANHDGFSDFVANEHIDHTSVTLTAGDGLSGGGTIAANRTFAVEAAQTTITSVLNTGLVIGRDSTDQIKFGTDNQIIFRVGNADGVTFKASGEIEATKFDGALEGNADTASVASRVVVVKNDAAGSFVNENNLILFSPDGAASNDGGNLTPESSTAFHYNPSTTILTVPKITGNLTGNASGSAGTVTTIGNLTGDVTSSNRATTIANNAVTLAKMAGLARGKIIYGDSNGDPAALALGSNGQVLTTNGTDISWGSAGGGIASLAADTTPQLGGDLDTDGNAIVSTSNADIHINPNGTGSVLVNYANSANNYAFQIGSNANNVVPFSTTNLTTSTNAIQTAAHVVTAISSGTRTTGFGTKMQFRLGEANYGGYVAGEIGAKMKDTGNSNFDMFITPQGTGNLALGNFTLDADQSVGSDEDNYVMTYDHSAGTIGLEAAGGGGASTIGALTDVTMDVTNFVDGILIQPNSDGSAPTTGTLNGATENIGIGKNVFQDLTSGDYNVVVGPDSGMNLTSGGYNVLIGRETGQFLTTATNTVAIGDNAGRFNTGAGNTFVGTNAGKRGSTGATTNNTIIGLSAGANNTGGNNTIVGHQALTFGAGGANNVVMGYYAGQDLTSDNNVAIGSSAALNVTSGTRNISIGANSMDAATSESDNIAIGYDALGGAVNGAEKNVVIGNYAGDAITSADDSVIIGHQSASAVQTGGYSVIIGSLAQQIGTGSYNVFLGYRAGLDSDSTQSVALGYGAAEYLDGGNSIAIGLEALKGSASTHVTGVENVALGFMAGMNVQTGRNNTLIGTRAGDSLTTGDGNVIIGSHTEAASNTGDLQLTIGSNDGSNSVTWIEGNSDGVVLGALTPLFFERAALDTSAVDFRVPTVQSSSANPNSYPMPFAGKVKAMTCIFTGDVASSSTSNVIRIRKNNGSSGSDIKDVTFTPAQFTKPASGNGGTAATLVKTGSDVALSFSAGDMIMVKRQSGSTDLNNSQVILWVSYNF